MAELAIEYSKISDKENAILALTEVRFFKVGNDTQSNPFYIYKKDILEGGDYLVTKKQGGVYSYRISQGMTPFTLLDKCLKSIAPQIAQNAIANYKNNYDILANLSDGEKIQSILFFNDRLKFRDEHKAIISGYDYDKTQARKAEIEQEYKQLKQAGFEPNQAILDAYDREQERAEQERLEREQQAQLEQARQQQPQNSPRFTP